MPAVPFLSPPLHYGLGSMIGEMVGGETAGTVAGYAAGAAALGVVGWNGGPTFNRFHSGNLFWAGFGAASMFGADPGTALGIGVGAVLGRKGYQGARWAGRKARALSSGASTLGRGVGAYGSFMIPSSFKRRSAQVGRSALSLANSVGHLANSFVSRISRWGQTPTHFPRQAWSPDPRAAADYARIRRNPGAMDSFAGAGSRRARRAGIGSRTKTRSSRVVAPTNVPLGQISSTNLPAGRPLQGIRPVNRPFTNMARSAGSGFVSGVNTVGDVAEGLWFLGRNSTAAGHLGTAAPFALGAAALATIGIGSNHIGEVGAGAITAGAGMLGVGMLWRQAGGKGFRGYPKTAAAVWVGSSLAAATMGEEGFSATLVGAGLASAAASVAQRYTKGGKASVLPAAVLKNPFAALTAAFVGTALLGKIGSLIGEGAQQEFDEYGPINYAAAKGMDPNFMNSGNMALASHYAKG